MPVGQILPRWRPTDISVRLLWPLICVIVLAIGLVVGAATWIGGETNRISAERQTSQITFMLSAVLKARAERLTSLTAPDTLFDLSVTRNIAEISEVMGRRASDYFGFERTFVVNRNGQFLGGLTEERPATEADFKRFQSIVARQAAKAFALLPKASQSASGGVPAKSFADFLALDDAAFIAATAPIAPMTLMPNHDWLVVVAIKTVDARILSSMSGGSDMSPMRIVKRPSGDVAQAIPLADSDGRIASYFEWSPFRPGDIMRERLLPIAALALVGAFVICLAIFIQIQRIAVEIALKQNKAQHQSNHDPLSGLPNRLPFVRHLERELGRIDRSATGFAVLFLDLDRFKEVNDTHGHGAGDELIKAVAMRLSDLLRGADTLARFGGDEFAIIQTNVRHARDVEALARRILEALTQPFAIAGTQVSIGVSIGISLAPENGNDGANLMRLADAALYQAKSEGRNRFSFFERQMDEAIKLRQVVEDDLRHAISNDELELHYQPQFSVDGTTIVGLEALVRWPHPTRGMIGPSQFISIAEERGLILPLGNWVLRQACKDGLRWGDLPIAVNVSAIQFRHKDFVESVRTIINETGFDAGRLELELTESVLVDDADAAEAALMELKSHGVRIALDDFGTGYSSLIYLRRFAFDKIKIDRSFLESMEATGESAILVHSIVHLGRALGLTVIAEGVENGEQHRFLQAVGCHQVQGFLFSAPIPGDDIDRLLAKQSVAA